MKTEIERNHKRERETHTDRERERDIKRDRDRGEIGRESKCEREVARDRFHL